MKSSALLVAAVAAASAHELPVQTAAVGLAPFGGLLKAPAPTAVARRDEKEDEAKSLSCSYTILSMMNPVILPSEDLVEWANTAMGSDPCKATAPASISSELIDYYSKYQESLDKASSDLAQFTDCGTTTTTFDVMTEGLCTTSQTFVFTEGSDKTSTKVVPAIEFPTAVVIGGGLSGASSWNRGAAATGITLAGLVVMILAA